MSCTGPTRDFQNLNSRAEGLAQSPNSLELVGIDLSSMSQNMAVPQSMVAGRGVENLPLNNVICGLNSLNITANAGSTVSGNNSPLSDSGISVDNVSHSSGGNAAMMNASAMSKLQPQSK